MQYQDQNRTIFRLSGSDRVAFLQDLITNDICKAEFGLVYSALLSAQGKYLADFFIVPWDESFLIDVDTGLAPTLLQKLKLYKLRRQVEIEDIKLSVEVGFGTAPEKAFADPRHVALGWRRYLAHKELPAFDFTPLRVEHVIPQSGIELISNDSYILEMGFERLNGVDFKKGCYVGQEVTARMHHKTELRKGLVKVSITGSAPIGSEILRDGKAIGTLFSQHEGKALAYLRFDQMGEGMTAETAAITLI